MNTSTKLVRLENERASNSQNSESAVNFSYSNSDTSHTPIPRYLGLGKYSIPDSFDISKRTNRGRKYFCRCVHIHCVSVTVILKRKTSVNMAIVMRAIM